MKPKDARTFKQVCKLHTDGGAVDHWWWCIDEANIHLWRQTVGEPPTIVPIAIPRKVFNRLVAWWQRDQSPKGIKRRKRDAAD